MAENYSIGDLGRSEWRNLAFWVSLTSISHVSSPFSKGESHVGAVARQHVEVTRDFPITEVCLEEKRGSQLGMPELKYVCKKC